MTIVQTKELCATARLGGATVVGEVKRDLRRTSSRLVGSRISKPISVDRKPEKPQEPMICVCGFSAVRFICLRSHQRSCAVTKRLQQGLQSSTQPVQPVQSLPVLPALPALPVLPGAQVESDQWEYYQQQGQHQRESARPMT